VKGVVFIFALAASLMAQQPEVAPSLNATQQPTNTAQKPRRRPELAFELQALDPSFWEIFDKNAQLKVMGDGFGFTEGPVYEAGGTLLLSDEEKNCIYRLHPDGSREELIALGDPDGTTFDKQHRLIVTASVLRAIIRLSPDMKTYELLADKYEGQRLNSPNDVTLGPDGAIYFTDPTLDLVKGEKQETPFQGVYRLDAKGKVTLLTKDLEQPNGLAFSPDGKYLYVDDTKQRNVRRYRFYKGTLSDGTIFADENVAGERGVPDGIKCDMRGKCLCHGPARDMGVESAKQASGNDSDAARACKPDVGRRGKSHSVSDGRTLRLHTGDQGDGTSLVSGEGITMKLLRAVVAAVLCATAAWGQTKQPAKTSAAAQAEISSSSLSVSRADLEKHGIEADWRMYNGDYTGRRYSSLTQVTRENAHTLVPQWVFRSRNAGILEVTPVVFSGVMYVTGSNDAMR
jgi:gluconolactonase